jgi:hypothetical protein
LTPGGLTGGLSAYAKYRTTNGKPTTKQAVAKALKSGRIRAVAGIIDFAKADKDWERRTDPSRRGVPSAGIKLVPPAEPPEEIPDDGPPVANIGDFQKSRASREYWEAEMARLKVERQQGDLVDRIKVEAAWCELVSTVRNQMLLIPDKVAPKAAVLTDVLECRALIDRAVREALGALSEHSPDIA